MLVISFPGFYLSSNKKDWRYHTLHLIMVAQKFIVLLLGAKVPLEWRILKRNRLELIFYVQRAIVYILFRFHGKVCINSTLLGLYLWDFTKYVVGLFRSREAIEFITVSVLKVLRLIVFSFFLLSILNTCWNCGHFFNFL